MSFYDEHHLELQERFQSRNLASALEFAIVHPSLDEEAIEFIGRREFFFLTTVRPDGQPTVSHKGGPPGFVKVVDPTTLIFPSYDGNGMFLSMGNITATAKIGMLFIDFETPHRVRVHADATVSSDDPLLAEFPGAPNAGESKHHRIVHQLPAVHRETRAARRFALCARCRRRCTPSGLEEDVRHKALSSTRRSAASRSRRPRSDDRGIHRARGSGRSLIKPTTKGRIRSSLHDGRSHGR